jgi:hypothetical protein
MMVSLLAGTFRTLAHYTQSPAELLASMNRRMLSRSHGGFTTCIVLRIQRAGSSDSVECRPFRRSDIVIDLSIPRCQSRLVMNLLVTNLRNSYRSRFGFNKQAPVG